MALTDKQRRFVDFYLTSLNATEAAKKAGYSPRTAHQMGYENLRKPDIQKEILSWIEANTADIRVLKIRATKKLLELILKNCRKPAEVGNQLRAIDLLLKYAESLPVATIKPDKESTMLRLLQNARDFEAKCRAKTK